MWAKKAIATLSALEGAATESDAFAVLVDYAAAMGADLVSYHHIAPAFAAQRENFTLLSHGFPQDWVDLYEMRRYHRIDPITSYAAYQTRPVLWSHVPERVAMSAEQVEFIDSLQSWLAPGDGMAVPAFGPSGRNGYFGIGRQAPWSAWSGAQIRTVQAICESFHLRFCELRLSGLGQDFELSERELTIVRGMSAGWTDPTIGATVNLRPEALGSAIAHVLQKMGVSDRPSAVLRARGLGLVGTP